MKSSKTVVTIVIVAVVLVAAYGVGLLIRQARVGESPSTTDVNDAKMRQQMAELSHAPGTGQSQDSPEARAKLKEMHAAALKQMDSATEEEKAKFKQQIRDRFSGEEGAKPTPKLTTKRPPDPNAGQNSEKTVVEPNVAGQG